MNDEASARVEASPQPVFKAVVNVDWRFVDERSAQPSIGVSTHRRTASTRPVARLELRSTTSAGGPRMQTTAGMRVSRSTGRRRPAADPAGSPFLAGRAVAMRSAKRGSAERPEAFRGVEGHPTGGFGGQLESDEELGAKGVGVSSLDGVVGMVQHGHGGAVLLQQARDRRGQDVETPLVADDHPAAGQARWCAQQPLSFTYPGHGARRGSPAEPGQRRADLGTAAGVHGESGVALELAKRTFGVRAQDAVHPARVESERAQALLELVDVVAAQHGGAQVEEPVPEPVPGFDQGLPRGGVAHPGDAQSPVFLEVLDGGRGRGPEGADLRPFDRTACRREPLLHVGDRRARVAWPERELVVVDESGSVPERAVGSAL